MSSFSRDPGNRRPGRQVPEQLAAPAGAEPSAPLPLAGVLVADFSRVLAGPLATMTLADLGATVVKVERTGTGDDTRAWGPPWTARSTSYFEGVNRSKRSVALDLTNDADRAAAQELARRADVVVENFRSGVLTRHGLDYPAVRRTNPGVVYCSITGFGGGAAGDLPGYDFVVQAVGGLMSVTGDPDGAPTKVGVALVDVLTGKDAVIGILAALRDRDRTGIGQRVEVNLLASCLGALVNQAAGYLATGSSPGRLGNQHPSIAPYQTLRCADGLLAVAVGNDVQFRALARVTGRADLASDPRFATNPARVAHRAELVAALEVVLGQRPVAQWQAELHRVGVPCGQVNDIGEAIAYAAELGLDPVHDLGAGKLPQMRSPLRLSKTQPAPPNPPPDLGEHTQEVLAWLSDPDAPALPETGHPFQHRIPWRAPAMTADAMSPINPADLLGIDATLTADEIAVRETVRRFCADRIQPYIADWFERGELPEIRELTRELGAIGVLGMHLDGLRLRRHERGGLRPGLPGTGGVRFRHPLARLRPGLAGDVRDLGVRQRRAEAALVAADGRWRGDRLLRPDRAGPRLRPGLDAYDGETRRGGLGPQRTQDVDHQRVGRAGRRRLGPYRGRHPGFRRPDQHARLLRAGDQAQTVAACLDHQRTRPR